MSAKEITSRRDFATYRRKVLARPRIDDRAPPVEKTSKGTMGRRALLQNLAAGSGAALSLSLAPGSWETVACGAAEAAPDSWQPPERIVDVNVYVSDWPFRRLAFAEPDRHVGKLRTHGVVQAWTGSFEALLHRDLRAVNKRLVDRCRRSSEVLIPFPAINPKLPDWEEDLRQAAEDLKAPGIRLHPDFHGYALDDPELIALLHKASAAGLLVQLVLMAEDERTVHPALKIPMVDPRPLVDVIPRVKNLRLILLNAQRVTPLPVLAKIVASGVVFVDIAWQEGVGGVANLLQHVPVERILFGSYFPRFYFLSALLKLRESAVEGQTLKAIAEENARRLLEGRT